MTKNAKMTALFSLAIIVILFAYKYFSKQTNNSLSAGFKCKLQVVQNNGWIYSDPFDWNDFAAWVKKTHGAWNDRIAYVAPAFFKAYNIRANGSMVQVFKKELNEYLSKPNSKGHGKVQVGEFLNNIG